MLDLFYDFKVFNFDKAKKNGKQNLIQMIINVLLN